MGFEKRGGLAARDGIVIPKAGSVLVHQLGPIASEITFIIESTQKGDEMETGTSMDGAARQLQVPAQCAELTDALEKLSAKVGELEMRLERVLRKEDVSVAEKRMKEAQVGLVPLADELLSLSQRVALLTRAVDSMILRLEV